MLNVWGSVVHRKKREGVSWGVLKFTPIVMICSLIVGYSNNLSVVSSQEYLPAVVFVHSKAESESGQLLRGSLGGYFRGSKLLHNHPPRVCLLPDSCTPGPSIQVSLLRPVQIVCLSLTPPLLPPCAIPWATLVMSRRYYAVILYDGFIQRRIIT